MTMPNTSSEKSISTEKTYQEIQIRRCTIFILPPSMAINMPHSSSTAFVSTENGRQRLPHFACSVTWLVSSKTAWRMSAKAEETASTASCGGKLRRKNRLMDSNNSGMRYRKAACELFRRPLRICLFSVCADPLPVCGESHHTVNRGFRQRSRTRKVICENS